MNASFKLITLCATFFAFGLMVQPIKKKVLSKFEEFIKPKSTITSNSKNFYDLVTCITAGRITAFKELIDAINKIENLRTTSNDGFTALVTTCENSSDPIPQTALEPLKSVGFVDSTGTINNQHTAIKIVRDMIAHTTTISPKHEISALSKTILLAGFFKYLTKLFALTKKDSYQEELLNFKFSFPSYRDFLQLYAESFIGKDYYFETSQKSPSIIDCGSNLGMSILFFKTIYPKSEILAFEPSPRCLSFLKKNIDENSITNVTIIEAAVSNKKGFCVFQEVPSNSLAGRLIESPKDTCSIKVSSVRLSDYILKPIDFVKIDVEGAETLIFDDLDQTQKIKLIREMGIECHGKNAFEKTLEILNKNNFAYQIKHEKVWEEQYNNVFCIVHAFNKDFLNGSQ